MNSNQLLVCLSKINSVRTLQYNCVAYDGIPSNVTTFPSTLVINTKPSSHPGEHWLGLYWRRNTKTGEVEVFFFDSFGNDIDRFPEIRALTNRTAKHTFSYISSHQSTIYAMCGPFVIYSIYRLHIEGVKWAELVTAFNFRNMYLNDILLFRFVKRLAPRLRIPFSIFQMSGF